MFNPFAPFEPRFLAGFKQKGVKAFVKQTYDRGINRLDDPPQPAYILIHFNDGNRAREHYEAIKTDPNKQLFRLEDPKSWQELDMLLNTASGQRFYTILMIKDVSNKARRLLDKKIHAYIDCKTNWRPSSYDQVSFSLEIIFGEIYVRLKYGAREIKMRMDELENQSYVL